MLNFTKEEFEKMNFEELVGYCVVTFDDFCTDLNLKDNAEAAINEDNYNLAIHLLEALRNNPADYYYYDEGMGTFMEPQPITCKEDLLNTGYIVFTDAK